MNSTNSHCRFLPADGECCRYDKSLVTTFETCPPLGMPDLCLSFGALQEV